MIMYPHIYQAHLPELRDSSPLKPNKTLYFLLINYVVLIIWIGDHVKVCFALFATPQQTQPQRSESDDTIKPDRNAPLQRS